MTLTLALILDAIFGEPNWLWSRLRHPAVLMGGLIGWCDRRFNHGPRRKAKGIATVIALSVIAWTLGALLSQLGMLVEVVIAAILLALRSLVDHVQAVATGLRASVAEGKRAVAMIVGRDTQDMEGSDVARAAIESAAENFSDGVIAPAFWFVIGGLPGLIFYKIINTADSMIGYKTPRHRAFGWAAARLDDVLNWIPARLTAYALLALSGHWDKRHVMAAEAGKHRSPNAGWPEAAMAYALNIALSGPRSYHGVRTEFPYVHESGKKALVPQDIEAATSWLWRVWGVFTILTFVGYIFFG